MMKQNRQWLILVLFPMAIVSLLALSAHAQDTSALRPPRGEKVALVVFEDLQCPDCARANPLLVEAARTYKIKLVRYDFPLPMHPWAYDAALFARYFDTHAEKIGDEYRDYVFEHQPEITKENLRAVTEKWALQHGLTLPFVVDAQGKLAAAIRADQQLGQRVGIQHTPTIYVVSNSRQGAPFVEVVDRTQLFQMIDAMKAEAR
jgi:protein-disulfide isomerase